MAFLKLGERVEPGTVIQCLPAGSVLVAEFTDVSDCMSFAENGPNFNDVETLNYPNATDLVGARWRCIKKPLAAHTCLVMLDPGEEALMHLAHGAPFDHIPLRTNQPQPSIDVELETVKGDGENWTDNFQWWLLGDLFDTCHT